MTSQLGNNKYKPLIGAFSGHCENSGKVRWQLYCPDQIDIEPGHPLSLHCPSRYLSCQAAVTTLVLFSGAGKLENYFLWMFPSSSWTKIMTIFSQKWPGQERSFYCKRSGLIGKGWTRLDNLLTVHMTRISVLNNDFKNQQEVNSDEPRPENLFRWLAFCPQIHLCR